jgi:hypothetical protein
MNETRCSTCVVVVVLIVYSVINKVRVTKRYRIHGKVVWPEFVSGMMWWRRKALFVM